MAVSVATAAPLHEACRSHTQLVLTGDVGYLSNIVTETTQCGGLRNPWIIQALPGQVR